jgi:hypothetical protein
MLGRFGFGPDALEIARSFRFSLVFTPDIFHAALANGVDILISDTNDPKIAARIPDWFRKAVAAETFRRLSALHQKQCGGHDLCRPGPGGRDRDFREGALPAENLRNQAVLAIKQSV